MIKIHGLSETEDFYNFRENFPITNIQKCANTKMYARTLVVVVPSGLFSILP